MNTHVIYAGIWWAAMIGLFIVAPIVGSRSPYRGGHRR